MRADCASLDLARQGREDGLISTVTQVSSAALLAIPGLLFGSDRGFPEPEEAPFVFAGIALFVAALGLAMFEQYLSALAYKRQAQLVQNYYLQVSDKREDVWFIAWVRRARHAAYVLFAFAVIISAFALMNLERKSDGQSAAATPAAAPAAATPAAAPAAATPAAAPASAARRRIHEEIGPGIDPASAAQKVIGQGMGK